METGRETMPSPSHCAYNDALLKIAASACITDAISLRAFCPSASGWVMSTRTSMGARLLKRPTATQQLVGVAPEEPHPGCAYKARRRQEGLALDAEILSGSWAAAQQQRRSCVLLRSSQHEPQPLPSSRCSAHPMQISRYPTHHSASGFPSRLPAPSRTRTATKCMATARSTHADVTG